MQLRPIKASDWVTFTQPNKDLLKQFGAIPVNDKLLSLWQEQKPIWLLRGGRGGGKSQGAVEKLLDKALTQEYFKCYYGRKVFDTVRGSVFDTLADSIEAQGLTNYFHYSRAATSTMTIECRNGNKFIPFGSDKAEKLKSIKDPTDIFCDEFDQFTFEDFKELYPTLRTTRGFNQFWGSFNTHKVYTNHWLLKVFFPELYSGEDKADLDIVQGVDIGKILINFTDNYFIDQEDYSRKLWLASGGNQVLYDGIANGAWGMEENKNPWLYNFDRAKHVKPVPFLPTYPIYVTFDFNNAPFEATVWQHAPKAGLPFIHCIKEFSGNIKLEEMCQQIRTTYPSSIIYVTGDKSGKNEDLGRNQTLYQMIASYLGISERNLNLNSFNLEHADSRELMNVMFYNYPNLCIDPSCINLIRQCEIAKVDLDSKLPSHLLKDRDVYKMDAFDSMRYYFQTYWHIFAKDTYFRVKNKR